MSLVATLLVAQLAVTVTAPDSVAAGEPFTLVARVTASGLKPPRLIAPDVAPFTVVRSEMERTVQASGWMRRPWVDIEYRYVMRAHRAGTYRVPPFTAELNGERARSRSVTIAVSNAVPVASVPEIVARAPLDPRLPVNFRALVLPETIYVGEQATYQVAMFVDADVRGNLRRNPDFFAPEMRSLMAYELPLGPLASAPNRRIGHRRYEAHVYQRALFPITTGRIPIPPAQLVYSLAATPSFFSREETRELRTDTLWLIAVEPPDSGRPEGYAGTVGTLSIDARLDTSETRVGDALRLTLAVTGIGNVKLFPRPDVTIDWAAVVPSGERVSVDSSSRAVRGTKEFDWVLTPKIAGELELPSFRYPYFDPGTQQYAVARTVADTVTVGPGVFLASDTLPKDSVTAPPPIRLADRGPMPESLHERPLFWAILAVAPVPALLFALAGALARVRRRRLPARVRLRSLARSRRTPRAGEVRRAWVETLGERLGVGPEALTITGGLARALRRAGVTGGTADAAGRFSADLDRAAYASGSADTRQAAADAYSLALAIDREALDEDTPPSTPRSGALLVLLAATIGFGAPMLNAQSEHGSRFRDGVASYQARRFSDAASAFADVARAQPRSADAWANYGTAAFAAGSVADAVVGWQRAVRLAPSAADVRARLASTVNWRVGSLAWVPPVSAGMLGLIAASLWVGAWLALAVPAVHHELRRRRIALTVLAMSAVTGFAAVEVDRIIAGDDLAVALAQTVVRELPALRSAPLAAVSEGDVVRIVEVSESWVRIASGDGREGWIDGGGIVRIGR